MSARKEIAAALAINGQLRSLDAIVASLRGLTAGLLDAWQARQLAPSTARLYRRVYGKRAPGSNRTKRLRKKRLSRLPMLETIEARFALQRSERVNLSPREQVTLWNQGLRERGDGISVRIDEIRGRIAAAKAAS